MGDWLFASDGEPRDAGRQAPNGRTGTATGVPGSGDDASAGVVRRLQGRLDRHMWLLGRIQADPLQPAPPGLAELVDATRRMRRDAECLLLMSGAEPGGGTGRSRRIADLLDEAAATAEEPLRVDVRPAPAASLAAEAATELVHMLVELVDHVTAVYPGARIDLGCRAEEPAGMVVEVRTAGASRHDPDGLGGRSAMAAAQRLGARSRSGLTLRRADAGSGAAAGAAGSVATVHCPAAVVTMEAPERAPMVFATDRRPPGALPAAGALPANGSSENRTAPGRPTGRQVDELFGPLLDLVHELRDDDAATPIFQAIASAWFRDDPPAPDGADGGGADPLDWETPGDVEWRAAAARAARTDSAPLMPNGLPRRRPGNQLVPPLRSGATTPERETADRVPERVRERLSTYQHGLRHGRHRAPSEAGPGAGDFRNGNFGNGDLGNGDLGNGDRRDADTRGWDAGAW